MFSRFTRRRGERGERAEVRVPGEIVATKEVGPGKGLLRALKELAGDEDGVVVASVGIGGVELVIASAKSWAKAVFVDGDYVDPLSGFEALEQAVAKEVKLGAVIRLASRAEVEEFFLSAGSAAIDDPFPIIEQVIRQSVLRTAARVGGWGVGSSLCGAEEVFLKKLYPRLMKVVDKELSEELAGKKLREAAMMLPKELVSVDEYPDLAERAAKALEGRAPPHLIEMRVYPSRGRLDRSQTTVAYFLVARGRAGAYVEYFSRSHVFESLKGRKALKSFASRAKHDLRKGVCRDYDIYTFVATPPAEVATKTVREG